MKEKILSFLKKNLITIIGIGVGFLIGFIYWRLIGCNSGTCPITSNPLISSMYGGLIGGLLFSTFKRNT